MLPRLRFLRPRGAPPGRTADPSGSGGLMWTEHSSRPEGRTGTAGGCSGRTWRRTHSVRQGDVCAHTAARSSPADIADSYARGVLPVVLLAREHEALHASAVLFGGHVAAFCAASGTGKSTLALAVAAEGGEHWADDTVILTPRPGGVEALSLPFPARVDHHARAHVHGAGARVCAVPRKPSPPCGASTCWSGMRRWIPNRPSSRMSAARRVSSGSWRTHTRSTSPPRTGVAG